MLMESHRGNRRSSGMSRKSSEFALKKVVVVSVQVAPQKRFFHVDI